jgi:hypothetical protein
VAAVCAGDGVARRRGHARSARRCTAVIGEVWIENNSNTPAVCRRLLRTGAGTGRVEVYGDATGGARGTAQVEGSDWDLAKKVLRDGDPSQEIKGFGPRVQFHVKPANPAERARVNADELAHPHRRRQLR